MAVVSPEVLLSRLPKTLDYNYFLTVLTQMLANEGVAAKRELEVMGRF